MLQLAPLSNALPLSYILAGKFIGTGREIKVWHSSWTINMSLKRLSMKRLPIVRFYIKPRKYLLWYMNRLIEELSQPNVFGCSQEGNHFICKFSLFFWATVWSISSIGPQCSVSVIYVYIWMIHCQWGIEFHYSSYGTVPPLIAQKLFQD